MTCSECGGPVTRENSFDLGQGKLLCATCFINRAQERRAVTRDDLDKLRKSVKREMAGPVPRTILEDILQDGLRKAFSGKDDIPVIASSMADEIERLATLAVGRQVIDVIDALQKSLLEEEEEIRRQVKRVADLE